MENFCENTICVLLAGGEGSRLKPLTLDRAKPSVPFGGKYRVVDFTLSNCLHSGLRRILVLTQYKSHSLQKHLRDGWSVFNPELGEYVTAIPPQMRTGDSWYSGTADAIFQNLYLLERSGATHVLILSGDHIYRMDYSAFLRNHIDRAADVSVACMEVSVDVASAFGIMTVNEEERVTDFVEKPTCSQVGDDSTVLASMGIYVFNIKILSEELQKDHCDNNSSNDFGQNVLPRLIQSHRVFGYRFGGAGGRVTQDNYWRDVGTLDAYYEANMDLLAAHPPLDLYQESWPIRTYLGQHPPARVVPSDAGIHGSIQNSILGSGCVISGGTVVRSVISAGVRIDVNAEVDSCILFDNVHVGSGSRLRRCIIDKHVEIPPGTRIGYDRSEDARYCHVTANGVVAVPKAALFKEINELTEAPA